MKRLTLAMTTVALIGMCLLVTPVAAEHHEETVTMTMDEFIDLVRDAVKKDRVDLLGQAMQFSADEAATFWPIYKDYETKFSELGNQRLALIKDYAENEMSMTDAKAGDLARRALELESSRTALKKECFEKLAEEMSPVIAARFLQVENQVNLILDLQIAQQIPLIGG